MKISILILAAILFYPSARAATPGTAKAAMRAHTSWLRKFDSLPEFTKDAMVGLNLGAEMYPGAPGPEEGSFIVMRRFAKLSGCAQVRGIFAFSIRENFLVLCADHTELKVDMWGQVSNLPNGTFASILMQIDLASGYAGSGK